LERNYDDTTRTLALVRERAIEQRRPIFVDLSGVEEAEIAATMLLVGELYWLRHIGGAKRATGNYPDKQEVYSRLYGLGFFDVLRVGSAPHHRALSAGDVVFLRFRETYEADGSIVRKMIEDLAPHCASLSETMRKRFYTGLFAAAENATEHAYERTNFGPRWWVGGAVDKSKNEITVVVLDRGVGIPRTLKATFIEKARRLAARMKIGTSDALMIRAAGNVSRTRTEQDERGLGFRDMRRVVEIHFEGDLIVYSLRGEVRYVSEKRPVLTDHQGAIGGTLVQFRIGLQP
jgi:hypothetical protein